MSGRPELFKEAASTMASLVRQAPQMVLYPELVENAANAVEGLMIEGADALAETEAQAERAHEDYVSLLGSFINFVDVMRDMLEKLIESGDERARRSLPLVQQLYFKLQMSRTGFAEIDAAFREEPDADQ